MRITGDIVSLGNLGLEEAILEAIGDGTQELVGAIYEEMEDVKAKSQEIVPYRYGVLRASADAVGVNVQESGGSGFIAIGYGGAASAYSIIQHETPPPEEAQEGERAFRHAEGRTWKYLEKPMLAAIDGMEGRIGDRIRRRLEAR